MRFGELVSAHLQKRYKRFLADVTLPNGEQITAHCPNTGKMTGCDTPGSRVWLLDAHNPKRKLRYTWELVETAPGELACVHSARANALVEEALQNGVIRELAGFDRLQREVAFRQCMSTDDNSRADFALWYGEQACLMEVKSVTLLADGGVG